MLQITPLAAVVQQIADKRLAETADSLLGEAVVQVFLQGVGGAGGGAYRPDISLTGGVGVTGAAGEDAGLAADLLAQLIQNGGIDIVDAVVQIQQAALDILEQLDGVFAGQTVLGAGGLRHGAACGGDGAQLGIGQGLAHPQGQVGQVIGTLGTENAVQLGVQLGLHGGVQLLGGGLDLGLGGGVAGAEADGAAQLVTDRGHLQTAFLQQALGLGGRGADMGAEELLHVLEHQVQGIELQGAGEQQVFHIGNQRDAAVVGVTGALGVGGGGQRGVGQGGDVAEDGRDVGFHSVYLLTGSCC